MGYKAQVEKDPAKPPANMRRQGMHSSRLLLSVDFGLGWPVAQVCEKHLAAANPRSSNSNSIISRAYTAITPRLLLGFIVGRGRRGCYYPNWL